MGRARCPHFTVTLGGLDEARVEEDGRHPASVQVVPRELAPLMVHAAHDNASTR